MSGRETGTRIDQSGLASISLAKKSSIPAIALRGACPHGSSDCPATKANSTTKLSVGLVPAEATTVQLCCSKAMVLKAFNGGTIFVGLHSQER